MIARITLLNGESHVFDLVTLRIERHYVAFKDVNGNFDCFLAKNLKNVEVVDYDKN